MMLCSPEVRDVPIAPGGAFVASVPLDATATLCPGDMFDGRDVEVDVAVGGMTIVTNASVNPVPYAHFASVAGQYGTPDCPVGYEVTARSGFVRCQRTITFPDGNSTTDEVTRVGVGPTAFWIDRYEASVFHWTGGIQRGVARSDGTGADDIHHTGSRGEPSVGRNGQRPTGVRRGQPILIAVSRASFPTVNITWFQAMEACAGAGKKLPDQQQWLLAASGTVDSTESCFVGAPGRRAAHPVSGCVSEWGVHDMIGNAAEWTAEWYAGVGNGTVANDRNNWPPEYGGDRVINVQSRVFRGLGSTSTELVDGLPSAAFRGGENSDGVNAGVFQLGLNFAPSLWHPSLGFRCVIPR